MMGEIISRKLLVLIALYQIVVKSVQSIQDDSSWINNFLPENYSATSPLINVNVTCLLMVEAILSLSAKKMEFGVDVTISILWNDNQLTHINEDGYKILPKQLSHQMFFPLLAFKNCKGCGGLIIDIDHQKTPFVLFNKSLFVKRREKMSFNCVFDLSRYPFDEQTCEMKIIQYKRWGKVNVLLEEAKKMVKTIDKKKLVMPTEFVLKSIEVTKLECGSEASAGPEDFCFSYQFTFERTLLQNMLLIFVPSILIVMLSWVSFWLDAEAAAPRVALGQTSLLTLAGQFNAAQGNLPSISSVKAIDIWMFVCISMAFASLLEFALAFNAAKNVNSVAPTFLTVKSTHGAHKVLQSKLVKKRKSIDFWARIFFPGSFFVFNVIFWSYYLGADLFDD